MPPGFARRGPPPDQNALRRDRKDDQGTWTTLPAEGRAGPAPTWPLPGRSTPAERKQWAREWARPQAVMWEQNQQLEEVANYVRTLLRAAEPTASPPLINAVLKQQEWLGLSLPGLARHRWRIGTVAEAPHQRTNDADRKSLKARFEVINGEVAS